jgi:transposase
VLEFLGQQARLLVVGDQLAWTFAKAMPVAKVAELTREHDTRIWQVLEHHVRGARDQQDFSAVTKVGMNETSAPKGQDYVSIFTDMLAKRVLLATEGRDAATVARFAWLRLKNHANLSARQQGELHRLMRPSVKLATARALRWREDFPAFYDQDPSYAPEYLRRWCSGAKRSRLQPIKDFAALVERHREGILAWHASHLTNGLLEGINSLVQAAKTRARSYRNNNKMITIIYLTAAKLPLPRASRPARSRSGAGTSVSRALGR